MCYILSWHIHEAELHARSPAWREEAAAFLARAEDELFVSSELDWVEVLDPESHAIVVGPGGRSGLDVVVGGDDVEVRALIEHHGLLLSQLRISRKWIVLIERFVAVVIRWSRSGMCDGASAE